MPGDDSEHYLKRELFERARTDPAILSFLESAVTDGFWYRDPEKSEQWMSRRCKELLGYQEHEMPHALQWCIENIHPDDLQVALSNFEKHSANPNHPYDQVVRYRHKNGSTVWVRCRGMAIRDEDGNVVRMLGAHSDVTPLKETESRLRDREAELARAVDELKAEKRLLRALIDNAPDLIYGKDTRSRFVVANRALAAQVGVSNLDDVLGKSDFDFHPVERSAEYYECEQSILRTGKAIVNQRELSFDRNGSACWYASSKAPLYDENGAVIGLVGIGRDITEQHEAEEALTRANAELERRVEQRTRDLTKTVRELQNANQELDAFAHMAAHGLQEPLRNLVAFANLLEEDLGENISNEVGQDLHFISAAALRMRGLIQNLLLLAVAGRTTPRLERLRLDDCVDDSLKALRTRLDESGARLKRRPLPDVTGDRTMLTRLYENLLSNAIKFTAGQTPAIELTSEGSERGWILGVRDNGIGVDPEDAERIFAPFSRLHSVAEYEGSGVGLAICRKTIQRHGGAIWVESRPGEGAHFKFTLSA